MGCPLMPQTLPWFLIMFLINMAILWYTNTPFHLSPKKNFTRPQKSTKCFRQAHIRSQTSHKFIHVAISVLNPSFGRSSHPLIPAIFVVFQTTFLGRRAPRAAKMSQKCRALRQRRFTVRRTNLPRWALTTAIEVWSWMLLWWKWSCDTKKG